MPNFEVDCTMSTNEMNLHIVTVLDYVGRYGIQAWAKTLTPYFGLYFYPLGLNYFHLAQNTLHDSKSQNTKNEYLQIQFS